MGPHGAEFLCVHLSKATLKFSLMFLCLSLLSLWIFLIFLSIGLHLIPNVNLPLSPRLSHASFPPVTLKILNVFQFQWTLGGEGTEACFV